MNSTQLYLLKNDTNSIILNESIINTINELFTKSNIKPYKIQKKLVNIMKSNIIQNKKNQNENKIIMIMNKISNDNINELLIEYINNLYIDTEEKYIIIQNEIFDKVLKDIKFIDNYIKFIKQIFSIEKYRLNLEPEQFINNIMENYNKNNENDNSSLFILITKLVEYNLFNNNIIKYISNDIINSNNYMNIYNWFNCINVDEYKEQLEKIILKCENMREKILIESLIEDKKIKNTEILTIKNEDILNTSIKNMIDEYLFIKNIEDLILFINNECNNSEQKNELSKILIEYYIDNNEDILNIIEILIKKRLIFKSNLSKGLLLYFENNLNLSTLNLNIIKLLKYLKSLNITKNIEHIYKKYKIKINYD